MIRQLYARELELPVQLWQHQSESSPCTCGCPGPAFYTALNNSSSQFLQNSVQTPGKSALGTINSCMPTSFSWLSLKLRSNVIALIASSGKKLWPQDAEWVTRTHWHIGSPWDASLTYLAYYLWVKIQNLRHPTLRHMHKSICAMRNLNSS